jgi:hypothetical protein
MYGFLFLRTTELEPWPEKNNFPGAGAGAVNNFLGIKSEPQNKVPVYISFGIFHYISTAWIGFGTRAVSVFISRTAQQTLTRIPLQFRIRERRDRKIPLIYRCDSGLK